jgi:hypothetical protein
MTLDIRPASDYPLPDLTQLLNLSFENYLVPVTFNLLQFLTNPQGQRRPRRQPRALWTNNRWHCTITHRNWTVGWRRWYRAEHAQQRHGLVHGKFDP